LNWSPQRPVGKARERNEDNRFPFAADAERKHGFRAEPLVVVIPHSLANGLKAIGPSGTAQPEGSLLAEPHGPLRREKICQHGVGG